MGENATRIIRGECDEPTPVERLDRPLSFLQADHLRGRRICALIDEIAQGNAAQQKVDAVSGFVRAELPRHLQDENEDLFPLLMQRCAPQDEVARVISRLRQDHHHIQKDMARMIDILHLLKDRNDPPDPEDAAVLTEFASRVRRHLMLENAVILPLARLRLTDDDLEALCRRMCQRRGLTVTGSGRTQNAE